MRWLERSAAAPPHRGAVTDGRPLETSRLPAAPVDGPRSVRLLVLAACLPLAAALGSIHAFSIFVAPLEARFAASRSTISLTYSLALIVLTLGVLAGHRLYGVPAARLLLAIGLLAAAGVALAARATALPQVWIGYSLLFGLANGLGYGYALHAAGQTMPGREGRAMGLVTACYALGAALAPPLLALALQRAANRQLALLLASRRPRPQMAVVGAACLQAGRVPLPGTACRCRALLDRRRHRD